jgi:hypothetical protein
VIEAGRRDRDRWRGSFQNRRTHAGRARALEWAVRTILDGRYGATLRLMARRIWLIVVIPAVVAGTARRGIAVSGLTKWRLSSPPRTS